MKNFNLYTAEGQSELPAPPANPNLNKPELYRPSKGLQDAVNVALALGQPLLVTGEPGTGKTQLAWHIAWRFRLGTPIVFNAQTTSAAMDLFYKYDALGHFQYNHNQDKSLSREEIENRFIKYQGLGEAIRNRRRAVVLIDEVDKAPRDLPNDVLAAIERLEFRVPEVDKEYRCESDELRPVIILTSNSEKNLPDAFLRRVVYYHIPFPDAGALLDILHRKIEGYSEAQLNAVIGHFEEIREAKILRKNPATAELIYWTALLQRLEFDPLVLEAKLDAEARQKLLVSYSVLAKTKEDLNTLADTARKR